MEITLENGQVIQLMTDKASIEIASDPRLMDAFNMKMLDIYRCIGTITFREDLEDHISTVNINSNTIDTKWVRSISYEMDTDTIITRHFDYENMSYIHSNPARSFISLVRVFLKSNMDKSFPIIIGRFTCVILLIL